MSEENIEEATVVPEKGTLEKALAYKEKYKGTYEESDEKSPESPEEDSGKIPSDQKVIQIIVNDQGIPEISYNLSALSVAELIGVLEMSKRLLLKKSIDSAILQQNMYNMLQSL